jgi:hypothetical protein
MKHGSNTDQMCHAPEARALAVANPDTFRCFGNELGLLIINNNVLHKSVSRALRWCGDDQAFMRACPNSVGYAIAYRIPDWWRKVRNSGPYKELPIPPGGPLDQLRLLVD